MQGDGMTADWMHGNLMRADWMQKSGLEEMGCEQSGCKESGSKETGRKDPECEPTACTKRGCKESETYRMHLLVLLSPALPLHLLLQEWMQVHATRLDAGAGHKTAGKAMQRDWTPPLPPVPGCMYCARGWVPED